MLSTLKKNASFTAAPPDPAPDFITHIHELDGQRLSKLRSGLEQQFHENKDFTQGRRGLEERAREVERL